MSLWKGVYIMTASSCSKNYLSKVLNSEGNKIINECSDDLSLKLERVIDKINSSNYSEDTKKKLLKALRGLEISTFLNIYKSLLASFKFSELDMKELCYSLDRSLSTNIYYDSNKCINTNHSYDITDIYLIFQSLIYKVFGFANCFIMDNANNSDDLEDIKNDLDKMNTILELLNDEDVDTVNLVLAKYDRYINSINSFPCIHELLLSLRKDVLNTTYGTIRRYVNSTSEVLKSKENTKSVNRNISWYNMLKYKRT